MHTNCISKLIARTRWCLVLAAAIPLSAVAQVDWMIDPPVGPGSAGMGMIIRSERSAYEGAGYGFHTEPLYLYEGERFYLHPTRAGMKVYNDSAHRFDLYFNFRLDGFPDEIPSSLAGMQRRESTTDFGVSYAYRAPWGTLKAEFMHDVHNVTKGHEARLGYSYNWTSGRWHLQPSATVSLRSSELNNYYYGVRPGEATAIRPAYMPGAGTDVWLGLIGHYEFSGGWRLLGGVGLNWLDSNVRGSPIVQDGMRPTVFLGAAYDFGKPQLAPAGTGEPLIVKVLYGKSTDCNLNKIIVFSCGSTNTTDNTRIVGVELGKPFATGVRGWPLDIMGYISLIGHDENNLQPDFLQLNAYMKAYYYGFPWREKVRTRVGMGMGISYAQRVPFIEARDQALRNRPTSRLLNYLDPTIDISVGDLIGSRAMKETYMGFGVSHRSGMFGSSQLLGNVDGGSNYIYTYVEWKMK